LLAGVDHLPAAGLLREHGVAQLVALLEHQPVDDEAGVLQDQPGFPVRHAHHVGHAHQRPLLRDHTISSRTRSTTATFTRCTSSGGSTRTFSTWTRLSSSKMTIESMASTPGMSSMRCARSVL